MTNSDTHRWRLIAIAFMLLCCGCGSNVRGSTPTPTVPNGSIVTTPLATTGCGKDAPIAAGTSGTFTIRSDGLQRTYRLHIPTGYDPHTMLPLLLSVHGYTGTAQEQELLFGQSPQADHYHFLVVYPQGSNGPKGLPGWATYGPSSPTVNDVLFFSDLITSLQQRLCIDARRIYFMGISNGGGMGNLLACQMAERIAAFALVAAAIYPIPGGCHPSRPVPYLEFHGTSDSFVPYNGSKSLQFAPVMQNMQEWAKRNGCSSSPTTFFQQADVSGFRWNNCQNGVTVEHYRIDGGGHTWPGTKTILTNSPLGKTTQTISATDLGWQFLEKYQLP